MKIKPKGRLYLKTPVFELTVSYDYRDKFVEQVMIFDNTEDLQLHAEEAIRIAISKAYQNLKISFLRKERHYDSKINSNDISKIVRQTSQEDRKKRNQMYL